MEREIITILMATYNGEKWITEQLNSIKNQDANNINIIISDDNSKDETINKIISFKNSNNISIDFLHSQNPELSDRGHANNFFKLILDSNISKETKWIAFSDQDDIWLEDKLSRAISFLSEHSSYGGWSSSVTAFWHEKKSYIRKNGVIHKYNHFFESAGPGCTYVLRREAFIKLRKTLNKHLKILPKIDFADWAIYSIVKSNNFLWHIDKKSSILYRQHSNNAIGIANSFKDYKNKLNNLLNGWFRSQLYLLTLINKNYKMSLTKRIIRLSIKDRFILFFKSFVLRRQNKDKILLAIAFIFMRKNKLDQYLR